MNAAKTVSATKGGRAHAPVAKGEGSVTEAPGQGDELAVVSRQDKETAMATANAASLGDRSWGAGENA